MQIERFKSVFKALHVFVHWVAEDVLECFVALCEHVALELVVLVDEEEQFFPGIYVEIGSEGGVFIHSTFFDIECVEDRDISLICRNCL